MSDKVIRRYSAHALVFLLSVYLSVGAFAHHGDYLRLFGGIALAYVFVWLGGHIERNREKPNE